MGGRGGFKRVAATFFGMDAARVGMCESSGSEHYYDVDSSSDHDDYNLYDLVNSFMEKGYDIEHPIKGSVTNENDNDDWVSVEGETRDLVSFNYETKDMLRNLLIHGEGSGDDRQVSQNLAAQTQLAFAHVVAAQLPTSEQGLKRRLVFHLRHLGFDAGLCKSRWEKFGRHPKGEYEYIDVNVGDDRFIVEVNLAREFEIARPTDSYAALLHVFPHVFVGKPDELKRVVRIMCSAIRDSMKSMDINVPPWRRNGYMQAKWFSQYKRTTNEESSANKLKMQRVASKWTTSSSMVGGFEGLAVKVQTTKCRGSRSIVVGGMKVGYLSAAFTATGIDT